MTYVGIDLEQFVQDPQSSGIQRVLQNLARAWPRHIKAQFVLPTSRGFALLDPGEAAMLVDLAFIGDDADHVRQLVSAEVVRLSTEKPTVSLSQLVSMFTAWLLPEVSYLDSVLERFEIFRQSMPTTMIGYDALPMTEPGNYRFRPGASAGVSRYFQLLTKADTVVCISEFAKSEIETRLRRDIHQRTLVAYPGGDHEPMGEKSSNSSGGRTTFIKLGTLESRKKPLELLSAFRAASLLGVDAELIFVGRPSASDLETNHEIARAVDEGIGVRWLSNASDDTVRQVMNQADYVITLGVEGYGIPVLEAIRSGTPVLFHGIQPAAKLMEGLGAIRIPSDEPEELIQSLIHFAQADQVKRARVMVDPGSVPTWSEFAEVVARSVVDS
jgi:glycosyltransferase involved in cell wall biosynthesis